MKVEDLGKIPDEGDVLLKAEQLKGVLEAIATGKGFEPKDYSDLRKSILGIAALNKIIPRFLHINRTADEFRSWIKEQSPQYAPRRQLIRDSMNPVLELLEYDTGEGALEFQKNYEEKGLIGNGGFGMVYLYEHRRLQMPFAVKVFAPAFYEGNEKELERFFQEARMLFLLDHPSIIKIYDAGMIGPRPFIRMEYFKGKNLNRSPQ